MAVDVPLAREPVRSGALRRLLEEECFVVLVLAVTLALVARLAPALIVQDTWLALVDGRWVAEHGLPHVDRMGVWTNGVAWTDQQWLAHLSLYGLMRVGGIRLLLAAGTALAVGALALSAVSARLRGASPRSVALAVFIPIATAPWLLQTRTQSFALPLFVAVYALLALDSRRPSNRVLLVLPILVLWGNLHGSAALGATLVVLHAVLRARRSPRLAAALAVGAPAALVVSPYGFDLVRYYRWMLIESPVGDYVQEWKPATPGALTALFFVVAFGIVALVARYPHAVSRFEWIALPVLVVAGLSAVRNGVWLGLGAGVSAPLLFDAAWTPRTTLTPALRRLNLGLASVVGGFALAATAAAFLARPASSFLHDWDPADAAAIAAAAGPHGRVLADDHHSDWLLWAEPTLQGRVAYDVRFELFTRAQLVRLQAFRQDDGSTRLARGFHVLTFASDADAKRFTHRGTVVRRGPGLVVVARD